MFIITGLQMKMARSSLGYSARKMGQLLGVSAMAISRYENGDEKVISIETAKKAETFFNKKRIYFGPKNGVCIDSDVFKQERWYQKALFQLLIENDIHPSSSDLIEAHNRASNEI